MNASGATLPAVHENNWRKVVSLILGFVAIIIYGFGLIAPLTPSESRPSLAIELIFVGLPLVLILGGALVTGSKIIKSLLIFEALVIIGFMLYLLEIQKVI